MPALVSILIAAGGPREWSVCGRNIMNGCTIRPKRGGRRSADLPPPHNRPDPDSGFSKKNDSIAVLSVSSYQNCWENLMQP